MKKSQYLHQPVLLSEILEAFDYLKNIDNAVFVDGTIGLAGHSLAIASKLKVKSLSRVKSRDKKLKVIGIDKDQNALDSIASSRISHLSKLIHDDFKNIKSIIHELNIDKIDGMLLDLGVSSMQLDDKSRGFSFAGSDAPLDMRMDQSSGQSAADILNNYSEHDLENMLKRGEERHYKKVAYLICQKRKLDKFITTADLISIIPNYKYQMSNKKSKSLKPHFSPTLRSESDIPTNRDCRTSLKTNPATGLFRALRLEVNEELIGLDSAIADIVDILKPGARLAIISFHSLEDRIVKNKFRQLENPCTCPPKLPYCVCGKKPIAKILTKKPITPSQSEIDANPRSRSAKLRVIEKLK